jgi:hypothetical protein
MDFAYRRLKQLKHKWDAGWIPGIPLLAQVVKTQVAKKSGWGARITPGIHALRPCGAALRAFKIAPGNFYQVESCRTFEVLILAHRISTIIYEI